MDFGCDWFSYYKCDDLLEDFYSRSFYYVPHMLIFFHTYYFCRSWLWTVLASYIYESIETLDRALTNLAHGDHDISRLSVTGVSGQIPDSFSKSLLVDILLGMIGMFLGMAMVHSYGMKQPSKKVGFNTAAALWFAQILPTVVLRRFVVNVSDTQFVVYLAACVAMVYVLYVYTLDKDAKPAGKGKENAFAMHMIVYGLTVVVPLLLLRLFNNSSNWSATKAEEGPGGISSLLLSFISLCLLSVGYWVHNLLMGSSA